MPQRRAIYHGLSILHRWAIYLASWNLCFAFDVHVSPQAGRSAGPFLSNLRAAARDAEMWVVAGVVLRDEKAGLLRGVALIGADGWLHGMPFLPAANHPSIFILC